MHPLRISAPTAEAAMALVELLAATRRWLNQFGFRSASVTLDGHTHLLRGSSADTKAMHERQSDGDALLAE